MNPGRRERLKLKVGGENPVPERILKKVERDLVEALKTLQAIIARGFASPQTSRNAAAVFRFLSVLYDWFTVLSTVVRGPAFCALFISD